MSLFDRKQEPSTNDAATISGAEAGKALAESMKSEASTKKDPKVKGPKVKKEVDPNAPPKVRATPVKRIPGNYASVIHVNLEKVAKYKGARKEFADRLVEGQTITEYHAAGGDNGFLRFFVNDGAVTFTEVPVEPKPVKVKAEKQLGDVGTASSVSTGKEGATA